MIRKFLKFTKWLLNKKPFVTYEGFHCGICGKWIEKQITIPKYKSNGFWFDTWGLCKEHESKNSFSNR
jgi:hypothetical protein